MAQLRARLKVKDHVVIVNNTKRGLAAVGPFTYSEAQDEVGRLYKQYPWLDIHFEPLHPGGRDYSWLYLAPGEED